MAPGLFVRCAQECLGQSDPDAPVVIEEEYGLAVIGTPLALAGEIVGAAVAGYALTTHLTYREVVRLARDYRLPFDEVWAVVRKELPESTGRLPLRGELLGILGNTLVSEHYRSRQLEETSRRLAEAAEAKDRFLAVLSHELRTPLTAILGYAVLVRRGKLGSGRDGERARGDRAKRQTADGAHRRSPRRVPDHLGVAPAQSRPVGLRPAIEAAATSVLPRAHAKGIRLDFVLDPQAAMVSGDPLRLQQIVSNLLVNAVKFTPSGGTVEVRLQGRGPEVHIVVHDTGAGIHPEFLPYVFDRFRQEDTTETRRHDGLGLGLAIVRDLVELHNGSISAESPGEGQGATFTVSLPALDGVEASSGLAQRLSGLGSPDTSRGAADAERCAGTGGG